MTLKTMLKNRMEEVDTRPPPAFTEPEQLLLLAQENTRGENYYH